MHLKFDPFIGDHFDQYSVVKGWYYYNKYKVEIPLIGIYWAKGVLDLYVPKKQSEYNKLSDHENIISVLNRISYEEIFKFLSHINSK